MYFFFCEHLYNFVKLLFYMYVSQIVRKFVARDTYGIFETLEEVIL